MIVFTHPRSSGDMLHDVALPGLRLVIRPRSKTHQQGGIVANRLTADDADVVQTEQVIENLFLIL
jgi:hypothetical protein